MNVLTKSLVKDIKLLTKTEELNEVIEALKIQQKIGEEIRTTQSSPTLNL